MVKGYTKLAIWVLNLIVLLVGVNLALYFLWLPDATTAANLYGMNVIMKAYPGWSKKDVKQLLHETLIVQMGYDLVRQIKLLPARGRFVTIDPGGFRRVQGQAPWPPDPKAFNIFVLGGSTTFGVGVPDSETIPSELQKALDATHPGNAVHVYNFGVPTYTSTQEMLTYVALARQGFVPDLAVFIDGLNDSISWNGSWPLGDLIATRMSYPLFAALADLPMTKWARRVARLAVTAPRNGVGNRPPQEVSDAAVRNWMGNREIIDRIATSWGKKTLFVWQPVCTYKYDLKYDILWGLRAAQLQFALEAPIQSIYPRIEQLNQEGALGPNFLYLGDMQAGEKKNLYVDGHHYTHEFSREIAVRIADFLTAKSLIKTADSQIAPSAPMDLSRAAGRHSGSVSK